MAIPQTFHFSWRTAWLTTPAIQIIATQWSMKKRQKNRWPSKLPWGSRYSRRRPRWAPLNGDKRWKCLILVAFCCVWPYRRCFKSFRFFLTSFSFFCTSGLLLLHNACFNYSLHICLPQLVFSCNANNLHLIVSTKNFFKLFALPFEEYLTLN